MYKYKSKCRWNMLLYIDGEVVEIRPAELFESAQLIESRYLTRIDPPKIIVKKKGRPKKQTFKESLEIKSTDANSSST